MSPHHVFNIRDFVPHFKGIRLQQDECITSYDVKALFTSVPIQPAINIIKNKLSQDRDLQQRTFMTIHQIISLLEFCLKKSYFVFQGRYYEQLEGAAMGSPINPMVANLYQEEFEAKALSTSPHSTSVEKVYWWHFFVIKSTHRDEFLKHINCIDEGIQFTAENTKADGSMPFLDTLVIPQSEGSLITTAFRKPTHTDHYLQWDSCHAISAKCSLISTLFHRAEAVCSTLHHLHEEQEHLQKVLTRCKYPGWALNRMENKISAPVLSKK